MKRVIQILLALVTVGFLYGAPTWAANIRPISDENLVASVRAIVTGRVTGIESRWDANRNNIYTYITIEIAELLKGNITTTTIVLEQLGGRVGDRHTWLLGSPEFTIGEDVLLFLNTNAEGALHTAHQAMGKFSLSIDPATGRRAFAHKHQQRYQDAGEYIRQIKQLLVTQAVRIRDFDNLYGTEILSVPPGYLAGSGQLQDNFSLSDSRFFEPDNDQMVRFFLNSALAPLSGGGMQETNNAIKAWNGAGSRLRLANGGATSRCGFAMDGQSVISFGDCNKEVDDPVDGQGGTLVGVMVVTGDDFRLVSGKRFTQIMEADIVFNNGFDSLLGVSTNLEELITTSIGLGFGLDFSSTDANETNPLLREAIMFGIPHLDGRGARLNTDDLAGINALYPFFRVVRFNTALRTPIINLPFEQQFFAVDGFPPYTFEVTQGDLPDGFMLSQDGVLTGKATQIETATFTVTVTDSANFRADQNFTVTIGAVAPRVLNVSPARLCYNKDDTITITGSGFLGTTSVSMNNGMVLGFQVMDDNTIQAAVRGPGTTGVVADVVVTNPAASSTLPSALLFGGPMLKNARIGTVTNNKKKVNAIIVRGADLGLNLVLKINGQMSNLPVKFNASGEPAFFGKLKGLIPKKGAFRISVVETGLNCESNEVRIKR
ncbi:MAG: Ig domain-containing protein [Acidobacteriota bacterium]